MDLKDSEGIMLNEKRQLLQVIYCMSGDSAGRGTHYEGHSLVGSVP